MTLTPYLSSRSPRESELSGTEAVMSGCQELGVWKVGLREPRNSP